ncbi:hypothetical protein JD844_023018 [Phrynosoma platyrhinos]|uniref:BPTI/Kunitz inhibitor domain-containing protein n=1 Tax=Phrynosoma platyrhinos TaxID=52577 RepID=A0ABQ7SW51_PHRPL|nr:hypothetical protein JD844_023018 [Phrynosoma platyrhinos]
MMLASDTRNNPELLNYSPERKMRKMRIGVFLAAILYLLVSVVLSYTTEISEDGEEYEDDVGPVLPPLKLATSICAMKADHGPCKALHDRYHFNIKTRQCEMFNYGGCQGNENNFLTLEECQEKCIIPDFPEKKKRSRFKKVSTVNSLQSEDASLPFNAVGNNTPAVQQVPLVPSANSLQAQDDSMLLRVINNSTPVVKQVFFGTMIYSSAEKSNCTTFPCNISVKLHIFFIKTESSSIKNSAVSNNIFSISLEQDRLPSLCVMRMDRGLCRAQEKRFFYNYTIGKCRPFSYTGCGGNENNFTTRKSCLKMCKKGFIQKHGQKGIMKIRRKRKKQRVKLVDEHIIIERI